jgi:DNA repair exonuclease SbcCD ATPase subunit/DNA repair exonuclease SbcCD nuclease subunit
MSVIPVNFPTLKKVIHLADVHIRLLKRHEEYGEVFNILFNELSTIDTANTVIVIAGDLVHTKTDMSPELIAVASDFLKRMADIAPTILIAGNHDLNLSNVNRLDALTPLVQNLKHPNLHYLKNSGVYHVADVDFAVLSIVGPREDWPTASQCTAPTKIALFHGPVHNAETDTGFHIDKRSNPVEIFDGFDIALLGDIHRHQIVNANNPIVVYSSSAIQQNHGESLKGHGWCEWDIPSRSFKFHELDNPYGFYTLRLDGPAPTWDDMPAKPYIRVFSRGYDIVALKEIETNIRANHTVKEWTHTSLDSLRRDTNISVLEDFIDVTEVETQNRLLIEYLREAAPSLSADTLSRVLKLNIEQNELLSSEDFARQIIWRPLSLKFDNLFTYEEGNVINFQDLRDIVGIFAPNATGKTSIADAVCFALYDKTPRTTKAANIMNTRKNSCFLEFRFEIDEIEYIIERRGSRNKKNEVKIDVDFWRVENGERISLNGEERRYTDENIRQYVGSFDEFLLTSFSSSSQQGLFVDKGQSERKNLLGQFLGLKIFERLEYLAKTASEDLKSTVKVFKKEDFAQDIVNTESVIDSTIKIKDELVLSLETTQLELDAIGQAIQAEYAQKTPLTLKHTDIGKLITERLNLELVLEDRRRQPSVLEADLKKMEELLSRGKEKIETEYVNIEEHFEEFKTITNSKKLLDVQLLQLTRRIQDTTRNLEKAKTHEFNPDCEQCLKNSHSIIQNIATLTSELSQLNMELESAQTQLTHSESQLVAFNGIEDKFRKFQASKTWVQETSSKIATGHSQLIKVNSEIDTLESKLVLLARDIAEVEQHQQAIAQNKIIDAKILQLELNRTSLNGTLRELRARVSGASATLAVAIQKRTDLLKKLEDAEEAESKFEAYKIYLQAVGKDGLPYKMISEILPSLQLSVNHILDQIVDFNLVFKADNQHIDIDLAYTDEAMWSLDLASGMEKFISGLAIRVALAKISALPKSNFIIIDEGLGSLDPEKLSSISSLFGVLRQQFDFVLLITHVDAAKDIADHLIEIQINGKNSKIVAE